VSLCNTSGGHGEARNHVVTYHSQNFAIGRLAKHGLGFAGSTSILDLAFGEAIHITVHGLNKCNLCIANLSDDVLGSILVDAKRHFSFEIPEIDEGHTFVVVANNNVTLVEMMNDPLLLPEL
jgi:hypothetical protein